MIWLTWRQFRAPVLVLFAALATGIVALAVTGPQLSALLRDSGPTFFVGLSVDEIKPGIFLLGTGLVYAIPAVVGVFWGVLRWSLARSRPALPGWYGHRASPAPDGWQRSSAWPQGAPHSLGLLASPSHGGARRWIERSRTATRAATVS